MLISVRLLDSFLLLQAKMYVDMIDWDQVEKTEPPLTMDMSEATILSAMANPLILPKYPNHTQGVERLIPVVTGACEKRAGFTARHRYCFHNFYIFSICIFKVNSFPAGIKRTGAQV